ncbi:hypothetical protein ABUW04_18005 [Streptacidiphilus sp. N1-10]|uniref:AbiJ-NTD3 domain-containing protein n=1 Tax=Streptacidiphilus jeojiensis TaxID=3229225 RepID=A0ABV6XPH9_9ACTN
MDQNSLRKVVEGRLVLLEGNAFQDCMDRLGVELYPGDYQPVRAAGPKGDTKNDGYCPKARVFMAAHATRGERIDKTKSKIRGDLEGCLNEHRDVSLWRFLTNDTLPGEVDQFIDNGLRPLYPAVTIEVWGLKTLVDEICRLKQAQVDRIIDVNSTEEMPPIQIVPDPKSPPLVELRRMQTGRDLWPILSGALAWITDEPDECTEEEEDLIDGAVQDLTDWLEISGAVEESRAGLRDAQRSVTSILDGLHTGGFDFYAGIRHDLATGGVLPPSPFRIAVFKVVRATSGLSSSAGR